MLESYRERGDLVLDDPVQVAKMFWAALHGVVQLFFAGHLDDMAAARAIYERTIRVVLASLAAPQP